MKRITQRICIVIIFGILLTQISCLFAPSNLIPKSKIEPTITPTDIYELLDQQSQSQEYPVLQSTDTLYSTDSLNNESDSGSSELPISILCANNIELLENKDGWSTYRIFCYLQNISESNLYMNFDNAWWNNNIYGIEGLVTVKTMEGQTYKGGSAYYLSTQPYRFFLPVGFSIKLGSYFFMIPETLHPSVFTFDGWHNNKVAGEIEYFQINSEKLLTSPPNISDKAYEPNGTGMTLGSHTISIEWETFCGKEQKCVALGLKDTNNDLTANHQKTNLFNLIDEKGNIWVHNRACNYFDFDSPLPADMQFIADIEDDYYPDGTRISSSIGPGQTKITKYCFIPKVEFNPLVENTQFFLPVTSEDFNSSGLYNFILSTSSTN